MSTKSPKDIKQPNSKQDASRPAGRPKGGSLNNSIKIKVKGYAEEAIHNIVDVMRFNKERVDELLQNYINNKIAQSEADGKALAALKEEEGSILKSMDSFNETTAKYSIKLLDYSYNIILHEDRLKVSRTKAKPTGKKNDSSSQDDDDDFTFTAPIVSLKPVERK